MKRLANALLLLVAVVACSPSGQDDAAEGPGEGGMEGILLRLLIDLESVGASHEEVYDTAVREEMGEAIDRSFIKPEDGYVLPRTFGMFSDDGNARVRVALQRYIHAAAEEAKKRRLDTPKKRLAAFQNWDVVTPGEGNHYDNFFGEGID